jgi:hypothetical protein
MAVSNTPSDGAQTAGAADTPPPASLAPATPAPPPAPPPEQRAAPGATRGDGGIPPPRLPRAPADAGPPAGGEGEPRPPGERSWFNRLFGHTPGADTPAGKPEQSSEPASNAPAAAASDAPQGAPGAAPAPPWQPPNSKEEEERRIQAEVDRRAAKAQKEQSQSTREQQRQLLIAQEREARETDAYKAAELRNQLDAMTAQEQVIQGMARLWDQATLDPLVKALPEADRNAVLETAASGIEGRAALTADVLRRLESHWRADEAKKLRSNPAFRKELLNTYREHGADEPELVTGTNGHPAGGSMNDWLRRAVR